MSNKIIARNRRSKKLRAKSIDLCTNRLSVFRSGQHIYAQLFSVDGSEVIAQASSLDKDLSSVYSSAFNSSSTSAIFLAKAGSCINGSP